MSSLPGMPEEVPGVSRSPSTTQDRALPEVPKQEGEAKLGSSSGPHFQEELRDAPSVLGLFLASDSQGTHRAHPNRVHEFLGEEGSGTLNGRASKSPNPTERVSRLEPSAKCRVPQEDGYYQQSALVSLTVWCAWCTCEVFSKRYGSVQTRLPNPRLVPSVSMLTRLIGLLLGYSGHADDPTFGGDLASHVWRSSNDQKIYVGNLPSTPPTTRFERCLLLTVRLLPSISSRTANGPAPWLRLVEMENASPRRFLRSTTPPWSTQPDGQRG